MSRLAASKEVTIETRSDDHLYSTIVWVVEVEGVLYVRSFLGDTGHWYQRVLQQPYVKLTARDVTARFAAQTVTDAEIIEAVSTAFVAKYPPGRSRDAMVRPEVLHTTLRLDPVD